MAIYQWNFKVKIDHTLVVEHPFSGNVVVKLDDRVIKNTEQHEMTYNFNVEDQPCRLEISFEETDFGGMATMKSWVHHFYVAEEKIPLAKK